MSAQSAQPTLTWEQYQQLPPDQRRRPLTSAEYAALTKSQRQAAGLEYSDEGAPANFAGPVFPNPNHVQPQLDTDNSTPVTRLPNGVGFQKGNYQGGAQPDVSNPPTTQAIPEIVGANMSAAPGKLPDGATLESSDDMKLPPGASLESAGAGKSSQPSVMQVLTQPTDKTDKEYLGYTGQAGVVGATVHGLSDVAQGTKEAIKGAYDSVAQPPQDKTETAVSALSPGALPIYRMLRGLGHTAADATHVAAAIHDINQSADPTGTYANVAEKTAAQGAGQALAAIATEGAVRAPGAISDAAASPTGQAIISGTKAVAKELPVAAVRRIPYVGDVAADVYNAARKAGKAAPELDATAENKPFAGGADEPLPQKVLDATGENKPLAGGRDEPLPPKKNAAKPAPRTVVIDPQTGAPEFSDVVAANQQAAPRAQPNPRLAADIASWQPPPEMGVTNAKDYGAAARADVEKQMGGPLKRGTATAQTDSILQKLRDLAAKNQADDATEAAQPKPEDDLTDILQKSLDAVRAKKPPQSVGSLTAAMQDTASFQQALQEKGPNAPLSDVAQRAQEIKAAKAKVKTGT